MAVESKKFGLTDDISLETIVKRVERVLQRDYSLETQYTVIDGGYVLQTSDADDADNSNSRPAITARFLIEGDDLKVTTSRRESRMKSSARLNTQSKTATLKKPFRASTARSKDRIPRLNPSRRQSPMRMWQR